jgi:CBS domain-containing protein
MRVRDILNAKGSDRVYTIRPDASVAELLDALAKYDVGALVASEDGRRVDGIVSERDIVRKLPHSADPQSVRVADIMICDLYTTRPDETARALMSAMTEHRVRHIPVVDESGVLLGILSIGDAVKFRLHQLEFERDQLTNYVIGQ